MNAVSTSVRGSIMSAAAFTSAVRTVLPSLKGFARRLTQDYAAAEDLVQDTLLRAWAARERFEPGTNLKAWLFRIARNDFLSGMRKTRRVVAWDPDMHDKLLFTPATQDASIMMQDLDAALMLLPDRQREAFDLIVVKGLSYAAAALVVEVGEATLRSRVARARASIHSRLCAESTQATPRRERRPEKLEASSRHAYSPIGHDRSGARYRQWKEAGSGLIGG